MGGSFVPEAGPFGEAGSVVGADLVGKCGAEEEFGVGNGRPSPFVLVGRRRCFYLSPTGEELGSWADGDL